MKKIIMVMAMLLIVFSVKSQTFCITPTTSNNVKLYSSKGVQGSYCLRIYVHVIRKSDGTGGQSVTDVEEALSVLDQDFNPHDIYFKWDNYIDYIDNDLDYNMHIDPYIFEKNKHSDGIDIYLLGDDSEAGGLADGVGEKSAFLISGRYSTSPNRPLVTSHLISHEMGHVLFLHHTHRGTYGPRTNECKELVDGSNGSSCGDEVADTPADPNMQFYNVDSPNCIWTKWPQIGTDANGDEYDPDETLIMSYSHPDCMSRFSQGQGERMKNAIASLPHLISVVVDCDASCPSILWNTENISSGSVINEQASNSIVASHSIASNATVRYKAGGSVRLALGFHAKDGSSFKAFIQECGPFALRKGSLDSTDSEELFSEQTPLNLVKVYPNPNKGQFKVELNNDDENAFIEVYDVVGKQVFSKNNANGNLSIDIKDQTKGIYFVRVTIGEQVINEKIVYQ